MTRNLLVGSALALLLAACATAPGTSDTTYEPVLDEAELATDMSVVAVVPSAETAPVRSDDDAADDPAIYVTDAGTFILGTDKKTGLGVYALDGSEVGFLELGNLNNIDLRKDGPAVRGFSDVAVASNRSDNTVDVFGLDGQLVTQVSAFKTVREEPYGICLGQFGGTHYTVVTHKNGAADLYQLDRSGRGSLLETITFDSQLEGCVFDEDNRALYVGEENAGISRVDLVEGKGGVMETVNNRRIDEIAGASGVAADIEGLAVYARPDGTGYLIASSQGNNTFAIYDRQSNEFIGRFRIAENAGLGIDGVEETDGLDATAAALPGYPHGILVVQDGFNKPAGENQNFKIVDWRDIETALGL